MFSQSVCCCSKKDCVTEVESNKVMSLLTLSSSAKEQLDVMFFFQNVLSFKMSMINRSVIFYLLFKCMCFMIYNY